VSDTEVLRTLVDAIRTGEFGIEGFTFVAMFLLALLASRFFGDTEARHKLGAFAMLCLEILVFAGILWATPAG